MRILSLIPGPKEGNSMIFAKRQVESIESLGHVVEIFFLESRTNISLLYRDFFRFRKRIREFQPNIISCYYGTVTSLFTVLSTNKPVVITFVGSDLNFVRSESMVSEIIGKLFSQLSILKASAVICVSENLTRKIWWRKNITHVVPLGINDREFILTGRIKARESLDFKPDEKIILFNNNAPVKRIDIAEKAVTLLKKKISGARLYVLSGKISFDKILLLLNACDCLLLCSDSEGSPNMIKEAMACNLPVVSTDVGDVKETIRLTIPHALAEQNPESLAAALENVLSRNIKSNGREILLKNNLTTDTISQKILNIYDSILQLQ
jgi:glycosyltransferase involved in cell wall biosynthesis